MASVNQEGCLSLPGIYDNVERAESVTVTALDRNGSRFTLNASGLLAACIVGTLPLEFVLRTHVYARWRRSSMPASP